MHTALRRSTLAVGFLAAAVALGGCGASADAPVRADAAAIATPVEVALAERADLAAIYEATGTLDAVRSATLRSELPGEVVEILVEEGDRVVAGQVLARLDGARARLELRQAETLAERLRYDTARNERLIERQMISRDAYDRARFELDTQQAAVGLARLTAGKSEIRAPFAGVVTRRHIRPGQWLALQSPSFELADFSELEVRIAVPERAASLIAPGRPVRVAADAFPDLAFGAAVARVSPVVERATGTVDVTVAVDESDPRLRPGLFVRLAVEYRQIDGATLVPKSAVQSEDGRHSVFVVDQDVARRREVRLGIEQRGVVEVVDGLTPGTAVVTVGFSSLRDGDRVRIVAPSRGATLAVARGADRTAS